MLKLPGGVLKPISRNVKRAAVYASFAFPLLIWVLVSYVPFLWHPLVLIEDPGSVSYFQPGGRVEKEIFEREYRRASAAGKALPLGVPANPIYVPAPHRVAMSLVTAFTAEPRLESEPWFYQAVWRSITVIFWGFFLSSLIAVPLGLLAGTYRIAGYLVEPFVEFFRYLPAPAFGALAVAIFGIHNQPKILIIFIGTFFQQILVIAASTRKLDPNIIEASRTLGAEGLPLFLRVVIPGVMVHIYRDMRILLGWAWTYLIVAEVVGTSTGITWFINQQAKYRVYEKVYAAILIIGIIGLLTDSLLARLGKRLFVWDTSEDSA